MGRAFGSAFLAGGLATCGTSGLPVSPEMLQGFGALGAFRGLGFRKFRGWRINLTNLLHAALAELFADLAVSIPSEYIEVFICRAGLARFKRFGA